MLLEVTDRDHAVHQASRENLRVIREFLRGLAEAAGVGDPEMFARQWHILLKGSIVAASEGDVEAALGARQVGALLLEHELASARA